VDTATHFSTAQRLHREGKLDAAAALYDEVVAAAPLHAEALHMRGVVFLQQGNNEAAAALIEKALGLQPANASALNNLGLALTGLGKLNAAVDPLRRATEIDPQRADAWANLANALRRLERNAEAVAAYRRALAIDDSRPGIHSSLGAALGDLERFEEALACHQTAIRLAPARPDYRNNLAATLRKAGRYEAAEDVLRLAVTMSPTDGHYQAALAEVLTGQGRFEEAVEAYKAARQLGETGRRIDHSLLFIQNYVDAPPEVALADSIAFARRTTAGIPRYSEHPNERDPERRLRIGLVSGDLNAHPVGRFLVAPLAHMTGATLDLFAYSKRDNDDATNRQLKALVPNWRALPDAGDEFVAKAVWNDKIDILVDLSGHTAGNRLGVFARKPAPVAVTYLGYFATTGLDAIDYVLCNRWLVPDDERSQWVEKPWYLPHAHLCLQMPESTPDVTAPPRINSGVFTFGSYNNMSKYSPRTLDAWSEILRGTPNSMLLLRNTAKTSAPSEAIVRHLTGLGIATERIQFEPMITNYHEHLAGYGKLDLALDPFPYNGGTTTVEALYMGVPVVAVRGDRYVSHMSESILRAAGLDEWISADASSYVASAIAAAAGVEGLAATRRQLRSRVLGSSLFDGAAFARDLEGAFRGMWRRYCQTGPTVF
jgi:predicted O-linked N-acetylglucosamine transferase (SPINDLY family)